MNLNIDPQNFSTCDIADHFKTTPPDRFRSLPMVFKNFGGYTKFAGPVATVKCYDDNSLVKSAVESQGQGRVLVVDGGGSLQRALMGGNLAQQAARNGWAGLLIDGCVRDVSELSTLALGILALASNPLPTERKGQGLADCPVQVQGVWVYPGDQLYADTDGVVLIGSGV